MTVPARFAVVSAWVLSALFAGACGEASSSPTSPSAVGGRTVPRATTGAVITGTVSGLARSTTSSLEQATTAATMTPVTVTVVGSNISTTVEGSGRFHLDNVPAGDVQLKFAGTGLDATVTIQDVEAGDRIDVQVRVTGRSVRIEAVRKDRRGDDDDDDEDDDEDDDRDKDEFRGVVSGLTGACPVITFRLNGVSVKTTNTTRFDDGACADVRNAVRVEVHGRRQTDGTIQADRIELED